MCTFRPFAGEPAAIRCNILGNKTTQLGVIRTDPISVTLQDELGNKLNIKQSQLELIRVTADGLDESLVEKVVEVKQSKLSFDVSSLKFVLLPSGWMRAFD